MVPQDGSCGLMVTLTQKRPRTKPNTLLFSRFQTISFKVHLFAKGRFVKNEVEVLSQGFRLEGRTTHLTGGMVQHSLLVASKCYKLRLTLRESCHDFSSIPTCNPHAFPLLPRERPKAKTKNKEEGVELHDLSESRSNDMTAKGFTCESTRRPHSSMIQCVPRGSLSWPQGSGLRTPSSQGCPTA